MRCGGITAQANGIGHGIGAGIQYLLDGDEIDIGLTADDCPCPMITCASEFDVVVEVAAVMGTPASASVSVTASRSISATRASTLTSSPLSVPSTVERVTPVKVVAAVASAPTPRPRALLVALESATAVVTASTTSDSPVFTRAPLATEVVVVSCTSRVVSAITTATKPPVAP